MSNFEGDGDIYENDDDVKLNRKPRETGNHYIEILPNDPGAAEYQALQRKPRTTPEVQKIHPPPTPSKVEQLWKTCCYDGATDKHVKFRTQVLQLSAAVGFCIMCLGIALGYTVAFLIGQVKLCSPLTHVSGGVVSVTGHSVGDEAIYTCFPGYNLTGVKVRRCRLSGEWSEAEPNCRATTCESLNDLDFPEGTITVTGNLRGDIAVYSCGNSSHVSICQGNGEWSGIEPTGNCMSAQLTASGDGDAES